MSQAICSEIIKSMLHKKLGNDIEALSSEVQQKLLDLILELRTDSLSECFRRDFLEDLIVYIEKNKLQYIAAFIDIDDFKAINELHGHDVGDRGIKLVGKVLKAYTPSEAVVCRYAGDEFIIMCPSRKKEDFLVSLEKIKTYLVLKSRELYFPLTITIAVTLALDIQKGEDLYKKLSALLRHQKKIQKNKVILGEDLM